MLNYTVYLYDDKCSNVHITHTSLYTARTTANHVAHTSPPQII
jgi:ribulose-5-phosphate 4-epimerase/fuculose-1-phosphate aldolase